MSSLRFTEEDFRTFTIEGLDARMNVLKETVRPKLEELGDHFAPVLSALTGDEMFVHVAKHARRSVNPPDDSWVAFANNKRGYKKLPHFQIGLWETHVFVWFALIYESPLKQEYGQLFKKHLPDIESNIPSRFVWSADHTKPGVIRQSEMDDKELENLFERLVNVKKAEALCGIQLAKDEVLQMSEETFLSEIEAAFEKLAYLYRLTQKVSV
ncbi:YktB family protein [Bacillus paralicheniformis]|uniref:YktB family protein n=1 Tax=Bacillus paralicheniformis TaxID=1648923 RepID=UPI003640873E